MTFPSLDGDRKNRELAVTGCVFLSWSSAVFLPVSPLYLKLAFSFIMISFIKIAGRNIKTSDLQMIPRPHLENCYPRKIGNPQINTGPLTFTTSWPWVNIWRGRAKAGFLSTVDIWGQTVFNPLLWLSCACKRFSSSPAFYPLDATALCCPISNVISRNVSRCGQMSSEG